MSEKTSLVLTWLSAVSENVDVGKKKKKNKAELIYKKTRPKIIDLLCLECKRNFFLV
jgi:hypothetical protein